MDRRGFEPLPSSMPRKRSTADLSAPSYCIIILCINLIIFCPYHDIPNILPQAISGHPYP